MDTRYDEALERARAGMPIDEIFPELKESEDEKIRKWIIEEIKATHDYDSPTSRKCVDDAIAYLERQKEQQPAGWSMEDENALVYFHELISFGYTENFCDAQTAADMRKWLNTRLKSIRSHPSWKPSEEQMSDLWMAATMNSFTCRTLKSLYNDLKKL